jgi:hypothetical protein
MPFSQMAPRSPSLGRLAFPGSNSQSEQSLGIASEDAVHFTRRQSGILDVIHAEFECVISPERIIRSEQEVIRAESFLCAPERCGIAVHGVIPEILCLRLGAMAESGRK